MKKSTLKKPTLKKYVGQKLRPMIFAIVLMLSSLNVSAQQPSSFILAIPGQNLNFLNANRTLITNAGNNGLSAGSVWRYDNLITTNGITIYGLLTIKEVNGTGTVLTILDDEAPNTGLPGRFQPRITTPASGGNVLFELEFYEVTTNKRAYISEYYFTAADIDGNEVVEIGGYSTYQVDATSGLTISQQPSGRTRFGGITTELNGVTFDNTAAFIAQYKFPYTKVTFALGKSNAGTARQFSVQFGTAGGTFTNPTTVRNPVKLMYINKTADTDHFLAGTTRKYTVVLDNLGSTAENVTLTDPLPAGLSYVPNSTTISVPAVSVVENVGDNFNSVSYARNNGTALWKNEWTELGETTTNPATGAITVATNRLNFATLPNGSGIERTANLTKAANASLSFAYTQTAANGTLDVQVSPNGSTYYSIGTVSGTTSGNFSAIINPLYLTADTRIRLVNSSGSAWATKTTTVDNLLLEYTLSQAVQNKTNALSGGTLVNGVPSNVIVSSDNITLLPGAKATITFDVNVNCNAQGIITNTATAACPGLYEDTISASHTAYVDPVNVTGSNRCDTGTVTLTASGAQGNQQYRWYAASTGGSPLATGASFTTPSISATTTYYVSFYNPDTGCESGRTPVIATVSSASSITGTGVISTTTGANGTSGNTGALAAPNTAANNNTVGTNPWANVANIVSSNNINTSATNIAANGGTSQYLEIPFPAITIPAGNSIAGISINLERNASGANSIRDNVVQLLKNNVAVGNNKAVTGTFWPTTDAVAQYGDASDLWGTTWESSDFANTKLRIQAYNNANGTATANIDYVSFTVYYAAFGDDQSSVNFKITGISGATGYTWTAPAGATITSGQGTDSILLNFNNAGQSGTYTVCATPTNSCGNATQICRTIAVTNNVNNEISGTVYNDQNGSVAPQKVDGTPVSQIGGQQLYAIITLNTSPYTAISSVTVAPDGTYKFSYLASTTANAYRVFIKTTPYGDGIAVPTTSDLPAGATFNGAIDNDTTNSLTGGNSTNAYLVVTAGNNTNNTNINFGIAISNPVGNADTTSTLEDTAKTFNILTNDTTASGTLNGTTVDLDPTAAGRQTTYTTTNGSWSVDNSGNITFTPAQDYFGSDSISYTVENSLGYKSNPTSITVTIDPVNDSPSFTKGADQTHIQTSSATPYVVNAWATNISKGPSNESLQSIVGFIVTNNNNAMFTVQPNISSSGQLQYTLAANASGTATISVRVQDDGGTANGGIDTSSIQTFTIAVKQDTDRDGIPDDTDLDDDNDGITDEAECPTIYFDFADAANKATLLSGSAGTNTNFIAGTKLIRANALTYLGNQYDAILTVISENTPSSGTGTPALALTSAGALALQNTRASDNPYAEFKLDFVATGTVSNASAIYTPATLPYVTIQFNNIDGNNQAFSDVAGFNTSTAPSSVIIGSNLVNSGFTSATNSPPASYNYYRHMNLANDGTGTVPNITTDDENIKMYMQYDSYTSAMFVFGITGNSTTNIVERAAGMRLRSAFACDTDGDGIADQLDLDSDGDGCSDAIEGGADILSTQLVTAPASLSGGNTTVNQNLCASPTCVNSTGIPQFGVLPANYSNTAGQSIGDSKNNAINQCNTRCYKPGITDAGNTFPSKQGITALSRAGADNGNWPMARQSAWNVLESKEKGFVINRVPTTAALANITNPVIGMMVYDIEAKCLKIYAVKSGETNAAWHCFETQACPD